MSTPAFLAAPLPSPRPPHHSTRPRPPRGCATPLDTLHIRGHRVRLKRDDLLQSGPLTGGKARKFAALSAPGALRRGDVLVSCGGAQSNAMAALAELARARGAAFHYYTGRAPPRAPRGNLARALRAGMVLHEASAPARAALLGDVPDVEGAQRWLAGEGLGGAVFVPRGGAWDGARAGVDALASELRAEVGEGAVVCVPAGTGTTALFLGQALRGVCEVVAVPVVGDAGYCVQQMSAIAGGGALPRVLEGVCGGRFADVTERKMAVWREIMAAGEGAGSGRVVFDMVYAPPAWDEVLAALDCGRIRGEVVFLHTGGVEGNESMLERFVRKGIVGEEEGRALARGSVGCWA